MRKAILSIGLTVLVLGFAGMAKADTVELNLFDLGCPTAFDHNSPYWRVDFDLGVTFTEITNIYINWSGTITAELVAPFGLPDKTKPIDALFVATLYEADPHDYFGRTSVQKGQTTYPTPDPFSIQSMFTDEDWSALLDGRSNIEIGLYGIFRPADLITVEYPHSQLDLAILVVEGTTVPEPSSLLLLALGAFGIRTKCRNKNSQ
jgi:hypothetical protein